MIVTVTANPTLDRTARLDSIQIGELNRLSEVILDPVGKGVSVSKVLRVLAEAPLWGEAPRRKSALLATGFAGGYTGDMVLASLDEAGIANEFVRVAGQTRSNLKILDAEGRLTELNEPGARVSEDEWQKLEAVLQKHAGPGVIVVMSGSLPAGAEPDRYARLAKMVKNRGAKAFVDADGEAFRLAMEVPPDYVKPNRFELLQYFGAAEDTPLPGLRDLCRRLLDKGVERVALSMGEEGAVFVDGDGAWHAPGLKVDFRSPVGAGDTMTAALMYGIETGMVPKDSYALAVAASAAAVAVEGTKPPEMALVKELLSKVELRPI